MAAPAQRMKAMRERRRAQGYRELRLIVPDPRSAAVRRQIASQANKLDSKAEAGALVWIESVAEFDEDNARS